MRVKLHRGFESHPLRLFFRNRPSTSTSNGFLVCKDEICDSIIEFNDPRGMLHYSARVDAMGFAVRRSAVQIPSSVSAFGSQAAQLHLSGRLGRCAQQSPYVARGFVLFEEYHPFSLPRKNCSVDSRGNARCIPLALWGLTGKCRGYSQCGSF